MIMFGFGLPDEKPDEINGTMAIEAPSKQDGGDFQYATNTFDETQVQKLADSLLDDFHKTTYVPNLNDENFAGTQSGEAMKYKLFGLLLVLSIKIGYLEDGIMQRLELLQNILNVKVRMWMLKEQQSSSNLIFLSTVRISLIKSRNLKSLFHC